MYAIDVAFINKYCDAFITLYKKHLVYNVI